MNFIVGGEDRMIIQMYYKDYHDSDPKSQTCG